MTRSRRGSIVICLFVVIHLQVVICVFISCVFIVIRLMIASCVFTGCLFVVIRLMIAICVVTSCLFVVIRLIVAICDAPPDSSWAAPAQHTLRRAASRRDPASEAVHDPQAGGSASGGSS